MAVDALIVLRDVHIHIKDVEGYLITRCPMNVIDVSIEIYRIRSALEHKYTSLFKEYDEFMNKPYLYISNKIQRFDFMYEHKLSKGLKAMTDEYIELFCKQQAILQDHIADPRRCLTPPPV
jgi:hypothetical protein